MFQGLRVCVVVPAYREARLIGATLRGIPAFVDHVIVVDDASPDDTIERARAAGDRRLVLLARRENGGVGQAIADGYAEGLALGADALVVMAGDAQMDPVDLPGILRPLVEEAADYVKGNRLSHPRASDMPALRRLGTRVLGWVTSQAAGVALSDSQCGYTAASAHAARTLLGARLWPRYGYPNDALIVLGRRGFSLAEVPVRPVYGNEQSGLRPWHALTIAGVIGGRTLSEVARALRGALGGAAVTRPSATPQREQSRG